MKSRTKLSRVAVLLASLALVATACSNGEPDAIELSPDQIFALQTACFNAGLFFDATGTCFADAALTERVATPAPGATTSSTPSATTVPPAPGDTKPPPVAPTTLAPGGTTPPATSAPTTQAPVTTTTTAPQPPPTIGNSEWILHLTTNAPGGLDQAIALAFAVNAGVVSGSNYDPYLEKTCTTDGTATGEGFVDLAVDCQNKGVFAFSGVLSGADFIEGDYFHENAGVVTQGQFTMDKN